MKDTDKQDLRDAKYTVETVQAEEILVVDFDTELEGSNDLFSIRPTVITERSGQPLAVYAAYNRETNIRETEARQLHAIQTWVEAVTADINGETLPGLEPEQGELMLQ